MRPVPWRHKLVNVGTWRSLCICWWQSGPELAATELVLCIFYPGISKPIIPNKLLLSTMWKMYVSYYELILSLHKRKHKSAWLTQHAEVLLGTETKVFFLLWVSWPRSVRKLIHVHTILPAVKVFSLPPKENKTFFLFSPLLFFFFFSLCTSSASSLHPITFDCLGHRKFGPRWKGKAIKMLWNMGLARKGR